MHRLFVALKPPSSLRTRMLALPQGVIGARWQEDAQLHLTLCFIGEVGGHAAEEIALALERVRHASVTIAINGVGSFETRGRPHTLWAKIAPNAGLVSLQRAIEGVVRRTGVAIETRAFLPHITLARLSRTAGPIDRWLSETAGLTLPPTEIDAFELYESELGRGGSVYHEAARYPLR